LLGNLEQTALSLIVSPEHDKAQRVSPRLVLLATTGIAALTLLECHCYQSLSY